MNPKKFFSKLTSKVLKSGSSEPLVDDFTIWDHQSNIASNVTIDIARSTTHATTSVRAGELTGERTGHFAQRVRTRASETGIAPHTKSDRHPGITNDNQEPTLTRSASIAEIGRSRPNERQSPYFLDRVTTNSASGHMISSIDRSRLNGEQTQGTLSSISQALTSHTQEVAVTPEKESGQHERDQINHPSPVDSAHIFGEPQVLYSGKGKDRIRDVELGSFQSSDAAANNFGPIAGSTEQELHLEKDLQQIREWQDHTDIITAHENAELEGQIGRHQNHLQLLGAQREQGLQRESEESLAAVVLQKDKLRKYLESGKNATSEHQRQRYQDKSLMLERLRKQFLQWELEEWPSERDGELRCERVEKRREREEGKRIKQEEKRREREEKLSLRAALKLQEREAREYMKREEEERRLVAGTIVRMEEEERLAAQKAAMRDCVVCSDSKIPLDFPVKAPTSSCEHPPQTCTDCLQKWIASELETKGCRGMTCTQCPQLMQYEDIQRAASEATFTAYEKILTRDTLSKLPEFAWCLAAKCSSGQLHASTEGPNSAMMECHTCKFVQCLRHRRAWHHGETCQQYDYRSSGRMAHDAERATTAILDAISKECPGENCGCRIQKWDGCDHMTCRRCKHEFCWECLAPYKQIRRIGNIAHQASCKYHTDNIVPYWPFTGI